MVTKAARYSESTLVPVDWGTARTGADGMKVDYSTQGPSLTDQSGQDSADINVIMAQYGRTGYLPNVNPAQPAWGDFSQVPKSLAEAIALVESANAAFMTLPAHIRAMANNDPVIFLELLEDPAAVDELVKAGYDPSKVDTKPQAAAGPEPAAPPPATGVTQTN